MPDFRPHAERKHRWYVPGNKRQRRNGPTQRETCDDSRKLLDECSLRDVAERVLGEQWHPVPERVRPHREASKSEEHTSELQSRLQLVCRLLLEKKTSSRKPESLPFSAPRALLEERQHTVIEQIGRRDRRLSVVELGKAYLGVGVDEGLLVDASNALQIADIERILGAAVPWMLALELAVCLFLGLGLFQRDDLRLGQHQALLGLRLAARRL